MAALRSGLLAAGLLLAAGAAQAGAALRSESEFFYAGTLGRTWATDYWDDDGVRQPIGCESTYDAFSNYAEYGWSYWHTLFAQLGQARARCGAQEDNGLTDLKLGLRGRLNRYRNDRAWELELTVPTQGESVGESNIGCGAWELSAGAEWQHEAVLPGLDAGYGVALRAAEAPLVHSARAKASLSGPLPARLRWRLGADYTRPLTHRDAPGPDFTLPDCGTDSTVWRGAAELKYRWSPAVTLSCGASRALDGEDASINRGAYCTWSRLWR